ncbi:MAG: hypothetical protein JW747_08365 [Candidatus Aminicenantes bacterium]|nr:hypothetical protein [Candidatus Aminicenantes bacterium]
MIVSALVSCDRFLVYERENIGDILTEQELAASAAVNFIISKTPQD